MNAITTPHRSQFGRFTILRGGRSAWSTTFRVCLSLLALSLLFQTRALHQRFGTQIKLQKLRSLAAQRLEQLAKGYDQHAVFAEHHLDLGPSVSLSDYTALLDKAAQDALSFPESSQLPSALQQVITSARSAVSLFPKGGWPLKAMPSTISSTIRNVSELPYQFHGWEQQNPGWTIHIYDDDAAERWVTDFLAVPTESGLDKTNVFQVWETLQRPILKSDVFRYLIILFEGGLYADSDTSSVKPISEWGQGGTLQDWTDPTLLQLDAQARNLAFIDDSQPQPSLANEGSPALIVSLETFTRRDDSEGGHIVQYAFAAAPGHPVFLDVLQRIVEVSRAVDQLRAAGENTTWTTDQFVLAWTGPKPWSAAVWRYLWARWGFDSRRFHGVDHPVRVGDVLILPYESFQAIFSELDHEQPPEACLWHGLMGTDRWRTSAG